MTFFGKIKWIISILLVFFIVLITNLIDKNNFNRLRNSVTTIYEDRIVANDILFDIASEIHAKEIAIVGRDSMFFQGQNAKSNQRIADLIKTYQRTKLTDKEQLEFSGLKQEISDLRKVTKDYLNLNQNEEIKKDVLGNISSIKKHLHDLSKIQLKEGGQQVFVSNKAMDTIDLFTQLEIVFLIIMAILVQIVILYKAKK